MKYSNGNVVLGLIAVNILVYIVMMFWGAAIVINYFAMFPLAIQSRGWVWQFATYMFVHSPQAISHLLFNMFALFIFGRPVEFQIGSREFLLYYFLTGTLAGIFSFFVYVYTGNTWVFLMGASGAVFAVQLAYASLFPRSVIYIWGLLPVKAPILVLGFAALEVFFLLSGSRGNVAHMTHLAGFAFGWLYFLIRFGVNPWRAMRK